MFLAHCVELEGAGGSLDIVRCRFEGLLEEVEPDERVVQVECMWWEVRAEDGTEVLVDVLVPAGMCRSPDGDAVLNATASVDHPEVDRIVKVFGGTTLDCGERKRVTEKLDFLLVCNM